jgi:hypothetical protein
MMVAILRLPLNSAQAANQPLAGTETKAKSLTAVPKSADQILPSSSFIQ